MFFRKDTDEPKDSCSFAQVSHIITPLFIDTFVGFSLRSQHQAQLPDPSHNQ